jgi:SAM-dependent methyltransferase
MEESIPQKNHEKLSAWKSGEEFLAFMEHYYWDHFAVRVLQVANALDLFSILKEGSKSARALAKSLDANYPKLEALLDALCAMGFLAKTGTRYHNTRLSETALLRSSPLYQGNILRHFYDLWDGLSELPEAVKTGRFTHDCFAREEPWRSRDVFIRGMMELAMGGQVRRLVEGIPLRGRRTLLDVGGGPGTYSIGFCEKNPSLRAVIFDLPDAVEIARENVKRYGLEDRIELVAGDWNEDPFPGDADVVLMSEVLHGPGCRPQLKLKKARKALARGGLLIVADFLRYNDGTGPL